MTRRRLEVLVSEMITRSLLLISRKNYGQALKVINRDAEDHRHGGAGTQRAQPVEASFAVVHRSNQRRVREAANQRTISSLMAMMSDLDVLSEGWSISIVRASTATDATLALSRP